MSSDQVRSRGPIGFWERRALRKAAVGLLRHVSYARHMREDVTAPALLDRLDSATKDVRQALKDRNFGNMEAMLDNLATAVKEVMPPRSWSVLREYAEIIAVALGVAMACRSYFLQPFKIPTGSMQPTLYGITYEAGEESGIFDTVYALQCVKYLAVGKWYTEVRADRSGQVAFVSDQGDEPASRSIGDNGCFIRNTRLAVGRAFQKDKAYEKMTAHVKDGEMVVKGQLLASGYELAGDHVFVDMISWNFRHPRRSEVMVFLTTGIHQGLPKDTHYIKRMVGLPGDNLTFAPPQILVGGKAVTDFKIGAIGRCEPGYYGYQFASQWSWTTKINQTTPSVELKADQYFACGDNTRSSLDSRYWGPVPRERLVGPAFVVYWPFTKRWGLIRR